VQATGPRERDDVVRAYAGAAAALVADDEPRSVELLEWAKAVAPRSAAIRELLGVARYRAGDFAVAHRELLAYRRLSGRHDQNHLLADCARATGHPDKVGEYVAEMQRHAVPEDRLVEGLIVLAAARAEGGELREALGVLEGAGLRPTRVESWHPRLWYAAADLYERAGDPDQAREYLEAIAAVDEDLLDVTERLRALGG
ncbi:MAG: tetratricopeptide repeat protein, partial [Actinomycetota bacterium]|nr:tetratricopeptide repeat protein [Actinomycetota bacterium]